MVEMIAPAPVAFGTAPDTGHGYSAARQLGGMTSTLDRTSSIATTAREAAKDLVTLDQEFFKMESVIPYEFTVRNDGRWILAGKTLEEGSDPNEVGGDVVPVVLAVEKRMAEDANLIQAAVACPDFGSGRNYLYVFRRDRETNTMKALAIEYQGNEGEFKTFLSTLTDFTQQEKKREEINFKEPLFFKPETSLDVHDVFEAADTSYETAERKHDMDSYLTRLKRDTDDLPNLIQRQQIQIEEYAQKIEAEMLAHPDVVAGLAAGAHAVTVIAEKWISENETLYKERLGNLVDRSLSHAYITPYETLSAQEPVVSLTERIPMVYVSTPTEPVFSPDSYEEKRKSSLLEVFDEDRQVEELSREEKRAVEVSIQKELIEPVIPALLFLISPHDIFPHSDQSDLIGSVSNVSTEELWQGFYTLLFSPETYDAIETPLPFILEDTPIAITDEITLLFSEMGALSFVDSESESEVITTQERVYQGLHDTFGELAITLSFDTQGEEHIPHEVETEIVDGAQEILILLYPSYADLSRLAGSKQLRGSYTRTNQSLEGILGEKNLRGEKYLSLFLALYTDEKTNPEMKELIALFLYEEIKMLGKEHTSSLVQNEKYLTCIKKMALYEPFFEKRKAFISEKLWQMLAVELEKNEYRVPEKRQKVETILFLLYILHRNEPERLFSLLEVIEQLKQSVALERGETKNGYLSQLERLLVSKQKHSFIAKAGIIYWFWLTEYYRFLSLSCLAIKHEHEHFC